MKRLGNFAISWWMVLLLLVGVVVIEVTDNRNWEVMQVMLAAAALIVAIRGILWMQNLRTDRKTTSLFGSN